MNEKPYHHGNLRNMLIEAGIELINEVGVKGFSLRKVAAKCQVSHTAPYSHFKDVDDLINAMGEHVTEQFVRKLKEAIQGLEGTPRAISKLGRAYIEFFIENPLYFQFLFYNSRLSIDMDHESPEDYPPYALFRHTAMDLFRSADLPQEEYGGKLLTLWAMVHGIASLLTNPGIKYSGNWQDAFKNLI